MNNIYELYSLRDKIRNIGFCDLTAEQIYREIYNEEIDWSNTKILFEDWEDQNVKNIPYDEYVIEEISKELENLGFCIIQISNSNGEDKTLIHIFSLFLVGDDIYRIESYGKTTYNEFTNKIEKYSLYCSKIVEWPTYKKDLRRLITIVSGPERIAYWNGLFSSDEVVDTDQQIEFEIISRLE